MSGNGMQEMMLKMMQGQLQNNPLFRRAQQMADGKSEKELEQIAKNLCEQRGINIDQAMGQFKKQFGI